MKRVLLFLILILLIGCAQRAEYGADVFDGAKINHQNVEEIAEIDRDIIDFAQDLYSEDAEEISAKHVFASEVHELIDSLKHPSAIDYPDTQFFVTYCDSLRGEVMNWVIEKKYERLRGQGCYKKFYTCEVNGEVDGAIAYFVEHKSPFYRVEKHYLTNHKFKEYRDYYSTFFSEDGGVSVDRNSLYDPKRGQIYRSYSHPIHVKIKNDSKEVKTYDINNISLAVNGKSYDTKLIKIKNKRKISHEKIVLSPGDVFEEDLVVKVRLIRGFGEEHVLGSTFSIDGNEYTNFKVRDSYDMEKIKYDNSIQRNASY